MRWIIIFLISFTIAQDYNTLEDRSYICKERGHVMTGVMFTTAMYCPPYVIDEDGVSYMVYPACNSTTYTCGRCGKEITETGEETRVIIWEKQ